MTKFVVPPGMSCAAEALAARAPPPLPLPLPSLLLLLPGLRLLLAVG